MLELNFTVHCHLSMKLNSQKSTFETIHFKNTFFLTILLSTPFLNLLNSPTNLNPSDLACTKLIQHLSDVTHELMTQGGSTFHTHRKHILQKLSQGTNYCTISPSKPFYSLTI